MSCSRIGSSGHRGCIGIGRPPYLGGYGGCYGAHRHNRQPGTMLLSMAAHSARCDCDPTDPTRKLILANWAAGLNDCLRHQRNTTPDPLQLVAWRSYPVGFRSESRRLTPAFSGDKTAQAVWRQAATIHQLSFNARSTSPFSAIENGPCSYSSFGNCA